MIGGIICVPSSREGLTSRWICLAAELMICYLSDYFIASASICSLSLQMLGPFESKGRHISALRRKTIFASNKISLISSHFSVC